MLSPSAILNAKLLIVDYQEANVYLLERMRAGAGYTAIASTMDPFQVCELHRKNSYDLILLDLEMPGMDGCFKIGSTLTTASDSKVETLNSGAPVGSTPGVSVFRQVGSSATLGTGTAFEGNIRALTSITADTGATVDGRLLAENGAVSLDDNTINVPETETGTGQVPEAGSTLLLLGSRLAALFAFGRRFSCRA